MLTDLQQPAKHWLADAVQNFDQLLKEGEDPSFTIKIFGMEMEVRLNSAPGVFQRAKVKLDTGMG